MGTTAAQRGGIRSPMASPKSSARKSIGSINNF